MTRDPSHNTACIGPSDCAMQASKPPDTVTTAARAALTMSEPQKTSGKSGWGGARANSGGPRPNSGGPRPNSGRPRKSPAPARFTQRLPPGPRWHVLQVATVSIRRIQRDLLDGETRPGLPHRQPFETWYPTVATLSTRRNRAVVIHEPMLKGYLLTRFDRDTDPWPTIMQVEGVVRLFTTRSLTPIPLPAGWVEGLIATADTRCDVPVVTLPAYAAGRLLRVAEGPMTGFTGPCVACDGRVTTATVQVFGRDVPLTLPRTAFEAADGGEA